VNDLRHLLDSYLATRRAMGYTLQYADRRLLEFVGFLETQGSSFITIKLATAWATQSPEAAPRTLTNRLGLVRQFAKYTHAFDPRTEIPTCDLIPYSRRRPEPYIYSPDDIDKILEVARSLPDPLIAATHVTLLGLLAVTGMRIHEAVQLDRRDIDRGQCLVTVRGTKFGKSRELPLDPSTMVALEAYARTRDRLLPLQHSSHFFLSRCGKPLIYNCVHFKFHRLIDRAGLAHRHPRRPRIHDLRHTFAVRTLINWYRSGVDVEPRLPLLSTYLGHVNPNMTYWYLTAVPELLALVSERAERAHEVRP